MLKGKLGTLIAVAAGALSTGATSRLGHLEPPGGRRFADLPSNPFRPRRPQLPAWAFTGPTRRQRRAAYVKANTPPAGSKLAKKAAKGRVGLW